MRPRGVLVFSLSLLAVALSSPANSTAVTRTITYFNVGGETLEEIEDDLGRFGPQINNEGPRHPGATRMEFSTSVSYGERNGRCSVIDASVSLKANMILPRWRVRANHDPGVRLVWDTLAADIRRHEESHIVIARNHARELEDTLRTVLNASSCDAAAEQVQRISTRILEKHDREQVQFDRVESVNFESRMMRLLQNRLDRMESQ